MNSCKIITTAGRDYYTVGQLDFYWESMKRHLGDTVEIIKQESIGNKYKHLCYTVEVKDIIKFEKAIKQKAFENWTVKRSCSLKGIEKMEEKKNSWKERKN